MSKQIQVEINSNKNSLDNKVKVKIIDILQVSLSSAIDLQSQAKQAHWNIKGYNFQALHTLFDEVSIAVLLFIDDIAERIVQLGGIAKGTVQVSANNTSLTEYPLEIQAGREHVEALSNSLANFGSHIRQSVDKATEIGDAGTADLLTGISRTTDKLLWMVEAHNQAN